MKNKNAKIYLLIILLLGLTFICSPENSFAALSLRVMPTDGGSDIRFGIVGFGPERVNREVEITMASDSNTQYQLKYELLQPLITPNNDTIPFSNLVVYGLPGSNSQGTMDIETERNLRNEDVLYTSVRASEQVNPSDHMRMAFSIITTNLLPGAYNGRIRFKLVPIGSSLNEEKIDMDIFVEVKSEAKVEISTADGAGKIELSSRVVDSGRHIREQEVIVNITGNYGKQYEIYQMVQDPVLSETKQFPLELLNFTLSGGDEGALSAGENTSAFQREQLLYTNVKGKADSFKIGYTLGDLSGMRAGVYAGRIIYIFKKFGMPDEIIKTLDLTITIDPVFSLERKGEDSVGQIAFGEVKPLTPARTKEVEITVQNNTGKRYQIIQKIDTPMMSKEGDKIPPDNFTLKTTLISETQGQIRFPEPAAVDPNNGMTLFISDNDGNPVKFKVIYSLTVPNTAKGGEYSTTINYDIVEI